MLIYPVNINLKSINSISLIAAEENDDNSAIKSINSTGYIENEEVQLEEIETEINDIEENIQKLEVIDDPIIEDLYNELSNINIYEIVEEEVNVLEEQSEDNTIDELVFEDKISDFISINKASAEGELDQNEEQIDEEIEQEFDYPSDEVGGTELISTEITLNIVSDSNEDSSEKEVLDIEEFVEQKQEEEFSLITTSTANAARAGWGYFFAVQSTFVANAKTKNAIFVQTVKVPVTGGIYKPKHFTIKMYNQTKTHRDGDYSTTTSKTFTNVKKNKQVDITTDINSTKFWRGKTVVTGHFSDGSTDVEELKSNRLLLNKKGVIYPTYKDPYSGKKLTQPSSTTYKKNYVNKWTDKNRKDYRNWYNNKFKKLDWKKYEFHHISPRAYSGSNDYSNLIPLKKEFHQKVVSPWWTNY